MTKPKRYKRYSPEFKREALKRFGLLATPLEWIHPQNRLNITSRTNMGRSSSKHTVTSLSSFTICESVALLRVTRWRFYEDT